MKLTSKRLEARNEKARKKRNEQHGFRGKVKKFILDKLINSKDW